MRYYHKYNANPSHKNADDCVVRALSVVLDLPWETVYKTLCDYGLKIHRMPNEKEVFIQLIKLYGLTRVPKWKRHLYLKDVTKWCRQNKIDAIVYNTSHCVGIKNGQFHDTWDSSYETVAEIYLKLPENVKVTRLNFGV